MRDVDDPLRREADEQAMEYLADYMGGPVLIVRRPTVDPPRWALPGQFTGEGRRGTLTRLTRIPRDGGNPTAWVADLSPPAHRPCPGNGAQSLFVSPRNLLPVRIVGESFPGR